ncbi:MAG TPA: YgiT-type zinc finger protein [Verrucomicrobiae bacterium]|nr:YgiT-type zinc finger protein [Verrucomicrobiae bacterium]
MKTHEWNETVEEKLVTYTQEIDGKFVVVERVPARVCRETGEQLFSPETVERLQTIIQSRVKPTRVMETPVYEFSQAA